jgi:class 3 adenylate cyclase/CheY-like chemotaxis protein
MAERVLILQIQPAAAKTLAAFFEKRGATVLLVDNGHQAIELLAGDQFDLTLIDLHLPGTECQDILFYLHRERPQTKVIVTNKYPDVRREFLAREQGVNIFLREPFTVDWIERALKKLDEPQAAELDNAFLNELLPKVRIPIRLKIAYPYAVLALFFALAAAYMVGRYVFESLDERYTNQLRDTAVLSSDWMVQEEDRILRTLRQLARTEGVAEAIQAADAERLLEICLPVIVNDRQESLEILDLQGESLLSLQKNRDEGWLNFEVNRGSRELAGFGFVQKILEQEVDPKGDKFAGVVHKQSGEVVLYIAGPIYDLDDRLTGVILVGKSLRTLVEDNRRDTLAQISLYAQDGTLLASSLLIHDDIHLLPGHLVDEIFALQQVSTNIRVLNLGSRQADLRPVRDLLVASSSYSEILAPWRVRGGEELGVMGVALTKSYHFFPSLITQFQALLIVAFAFLAVFATGIVLANRVTRPLGRMVHASAQVAGGNLEIRVPSDGNDEVAVLAHAFNQMVTGLQEGFIYRDLLGRTVSPEVREAMRSSFASGTLKLEGQSTVGTVLMSDIRSFTTLSEKEEPAVVLNWLNEYFSELVPVVTAQGGVVDKFEGDAMLAFFGILPTPLEPEESALHGCQAAIEMLLVIEKINHRRLERGEPPLITGIGVHTGVLTAGGLGASDRLNFTIIGNTVNTTARMQEITRQFGESGALISESTIAALKGKRGKFHFEPLGEHSFPGKTEALWLYRIIPGGRVRFDEGLHEDHSVKAI